MQQSRESPSSQNFLTDADRALVKRSQPQKRRGKRVSRSLSDEKEISEETVGFGCALERNTHHFVVSIPQDTTGSIRIIERYGIQEEQVERCILPRQAWDAFAEEIRYEFNLRLKEKKLSTGQWEIGENKVERLLGKELLVLAWAVEQADSKTIPQALRNWKGLRPEERWWLCTMTAAATGLVDDSTIGWRKALRYALTENPVDWRAG